VIATVTLAVGVGLIALAIWLRTKSHQCRSWPAVDGVVLESRVDDASLETMKPVLRYEYVVGGRKFVGFRVSYSGYGVSRSAMEALLAPYKAGQTVRVHYEPDNPAHAVLNARGASDWLYWLVAGLMFFVLYVYLLTL
jgi:hypothetical protein